MSKRIAVVLASAFALVALLVPAGSAQAAWRHDPWCSGVTLKPGKSCTSWPLNINSIYTSWRTTTTGKGNVCVGLIQYGGSQNGQPVAGVPGLSCSGVSIAYSPGTAHVGDLGYDLWYIYRYNPCMGYSYRYGQATIINFSSATIYILPGLYDGLLFGTEVVHWL
jgi:hypothetical protein